MKHKNVNYISSHKLYRIKKKYINISHNDIRNGNIITFTYESSSSNKNPHVFVLNKKYLNLLHGLVIDYMSLREFDKLISYIFKVDTSKNNINIIEILNKKSPSEVKLLYETKLKHFLKNNIKQSVYRTYKINKLNNIKLVDYII